MASKGLISVKWSTLIQSSRWIYALIVIFVVLCIAMIAIGPPNYVKMYIARTPHVLTLDLGDERRFPKCYIKNNQNSITTLLEDFKIPRTLECRLYSDIFDKFYDLRISTSTLQLKPPAEFYEKVKTWLNNKADLLEQMTSQSIIRVFNKLTREETIMNPIRDKRPLPESNSAQAFLKELVESSRKTCDFCDYTKNTAMDPFGRLETPLSYTIANAFKIDKFNSMVVMRDHDPIYWTFTQLVDVFQVVDKWFSKVKEQDPKSIYRHIYWDLLPKAGGSQVHPHIHMTANAHGFFGFSGNWVFAASKYRNENPTRNFFEDLVYLHDQLGLVTRIGSAAALAHINPRKDNELVIMGKENDPDFLKLLYSAVRVYLDEMKLYSFSMLISYPTEETKSYMPIFVRVATRGDISERRSDFSSLELYSAAGVNSDPIKVAKLLQTYVKKFSAQLDS